MDCSEAGTAAILYLILYIIPVLVLCGYMITSLPLLSHSGPTVSRDLAKPPHGFALKGPGKYLKSGEGCSLATRQKMKELLKQHPVNKDPAFQRGTGGIRLSWESVPRAGSIFRHLYDNGTIDFVSLRWTNLGNEVVWGVRDQPGRPMYWQLKPTEMDVAKWLPIFMEGIREYEEPYRFLAIMGCWDLIEEAGVRLHSFAADMVPALKKALDTREPTVVSVAVELMKSVLRSDPKVGGCVMSCDQTGPHMLYLLRHTCPLSPGPRTPLPHPTQFLCWSIRLARPGSSTSGSSPRCSTSSFPAASSSTSATLRQVKSAI